MPILDPNHNPNVHQTFPKYQLNITLFCTNGVTSFNQCLSNHVSVTPNMLLLIRDGKSRSFYGLKVFWVSHWRDPDHTSHLSHMSQHHQDRRNPIGETEKLLHFTSILNWRYINLRDTVYFALIKNVDHKKKGYFAIWQIWVCCWLVHEDESAGSLDLLLYGYGSESARVCCVLHSE